MHREVGRDMRASDSLDSYVGFASRRWRVRAARMAAVALLTGFVCLLGMLLQATQAAPRLFAAPLARAASNPDASGSLTLVSPSSGQGPVGAHVTVSGSGWSGGSVAVGAAQSAANCASGTTWAATFTTQAASGGSFTATFTWPSSLSSGTYALCAAPAQGNGPAAAGGVAGQTYTVKSPQPPALTLSTFNAKVGQTVTINGANFVGVSNVNISIVQNDASTLITTVSPDGNGNFATQYQPNPNNVGSAKITASSEPDGNAPPALTAQASLVVGAAPTATPSPSPSPSPSPTAEATPTSAVVTPPPNKQSGGGGLIILLIVGIVLSLLVIIGAVAFLLLRQRGGPEQQGYPGGQGGPGGGYGGYGGTGTGYGPAQTGRYSTSGTYGRSGMYDVPEPYNGPQVGGVAQWDEPEPQPGADWQPRPMSGARSRYDDPNYAPYPTTGYPTSGYPQGGGPGESVPAPVPDYYGPPDPWANTTGAYGGDAWGNNPPPPASGSTRYGGPPPERGQGQGPRDPRQQQNGGWDDGGWNAGPGQGQPDEPDDGSGRWRTRPQDPDRQW